MVAARAGRSPTPLTVCSRRGSPAASVLRRSTDVDLQRVGGGSEVVAPHAVEDLPAGEHLAWVVHEQLEPAGTRCGSDPSGRSPRRTSATAGRARGHRSADLGSPLHPSGAAAPAPGLAAPRARTAWTVVVGTRFQARDAVATSSRALSMRTGVRSPMSRCAGTPPAVEPRHEDVEQDAAAGVAAWLRTASRPSHAICTRSLEVQVSLERIALRRARRRRPWMRMSPTMVSPNLKAT